MAKLILGIGTSQSPLVTVAPTHWSQHAENDKKKNDICRPDGTLVSYQQLEAEVGDKFKDIVTPLQFLKLFESAQIAVKRLSDELANAKPDVLVVIGDDHAELFDTNNMPAFSIYRGKELANHLEELPSGAAQWERDRRAIGIIDPARHYPAAPDFAEELIERLIDKEVDVGTVGEPSYPGKGIGHAWAFVVNRLLGGRAIPIVPVILNSGYPPNIPTPARCYKVGRALRTAIEESPRDLRVAVVVAGGMSHYLVNEKLDRQVMAALEAGDAETLMRIPREALRMGSGEIRDWIVMAGTVSGLKHQWGEYLPGYRTPAGTGIGLAFACWA